MSRKGARSGDKPAFRRSGRSESAAVAMPARPTLSWSRSAGRGLHRAGERTAEALSAQFAAPAAAPAQIDGMVLNVRPDPVDFRDAVYLPSLAQLRTRLVPPPLAELELTVRDQVSEGSCTGQALAAVIDMQNVHRLSDGAAVPAQVSARMLYESARAFDEYADDHLPGSSVRGAIKGFYHRGVCGEDKAPYISGDTTWRLTADLAKDARRVTLGTYFRVRHVLNDYHCALADAGAILCSAMIHEGWGKEQVKSAGGRILPPGGNLKTVRLIGAHAFAIVGYVPEGFLVLNSWGEDWGGYGAQGAAAEVTADLPGVALWGYDDWCDHVLDAWVLRLQVPTALPSGFTGGYHLVRQPTVLKDDPLGQPVVPSAVPASEVTGHFINIADGRFVTAPPYNNDRQTFEETARLLVDNEEAPDDKRYDHLLLYAHGGLNDVRAAAARAAAMTPVFKQNNIYPLFYFWHTGLGETAAELLQRLFLGVADRAGGFLDLIDNLLEEAARPFGRPVWREMKADARRSFGGDGGGGDGWTATRILAEAMATRTTRPMQLHLVGHSAGAIFLGEMLARARADGFPLLPQLATVSLLAPACTVSFFDRHFKDVATPAARDAFAVYNLTDAAEQDDRVAELYGKSLLYLVSNAFEEEVPAPIAGMHMFWEDYAAPAGIAYHRANIPAAPGAQPVSRAITHGSFDNDPATMNHVLARVLGRDTITDQEGGFSVADLTGRGF